MKIKLAKQHKDIIFWALLISGIGFCIGGAFVPVLIPVGMTLLAGAIGVAKDAAAEPVQNIPADPAPPLESEIPDALHDESADVNLHFDYVRHHHSTLRVSEEDIKEHVEKDAIESKVSKRLH